MSKGMMMGDDDAAAMQKYSKTVRCLSRKAEVFEMVLTDFLQRVKHNDETWNFIQEKSLAKFEFESKMSFIN